MREAVYLTLLYTVTARMTPALRWAATRASVSLIVRDKVARRCPQTTTFEEGGEPKRNRTEVFCLPACIDRPVMYMKGCVGLELAAWQSARPPHSD